MAFENNIVDEAYSKLRTEVLNLGNLKSNIYDEDNDIVYEDNSLIILKKYYLILQNNIEEHAFESIYTYKPEYFAYKIYGTASYDYLVLHANKIKSKKEFTRDILNNKILYYNKGVVAKLASEMDSYVKDQTISINSSDYLLYNV